MLTIKQIELNIISAMSYLRNNERDSFLLEMGRLQVFANYIPELEKDPRYILLQSVLKNLPFNQDFQNEILKEIADKLTSSSFEEMFEKLKEIGFGPAKEVETISNKAFQSIFQNTLSKYIPKEF